MPYFKFPQITSISSEEVPSTGFLTSWDARLSRADLFSKWQRQQWAEVNCNDIRTWKCYWRKGGCGNYISKTSAYTDEALAWTTAGGPVPTEAAKDWERTGITEGCIPVPLVVDAMGALVIVNDPDATTEGELDTETKGVTGTGLDATPDTLGEMLELMEEIAGVSAWERPTAGVGWDVVTAISVCVPWAASFWACSRANCKQIYEVRLKVKNPIERKYEKKGYESGNSWFQPSVLLVWSTLILLSPYCNSTYANSW